MRPTVLVRGVAMLIAVLSLLLANAPVAALDRNSDSKDILVIGRQIADLQAALQACLAKQCPPDEDIAASLALAESQLLDGKYPDARKTLLGALKRNRRQADAYPVPVSDLY